MDIIYSLLGMFETIFAIVLITVCFNRSPKTSKGFKIPKLPKLKHNEVFSQPVVDLDNTYLNVSF